MTTAWILTFLSCTCAFFYAIHLQNQARRKHKDKD